MKSICVFCGARMGSEPKYRELATLAGVAIAEAGLTIVYGGGRVGLMGAVADSALAAGGKVIGIIPKFLAEKEVEHKGLTEIHVVASMHERKTMMEELSDAFVALPGGAGHSRKSLSNGPGRNSASTPNRSASSMPTAITTRWSK